MLDSQIVRLFHFLTLDQWLSFHSFIIFILIGDLQNLFFIDSLYSLFFKFVKLFGKCTLEVRHYSLRRWLIGIWSCIFFFMRYKLKLFSTIFGPVREFDKFLLVFMFDRDSIGYRILYFSLWRIQNTICKESYPTSFQSVNFTRGGSGICLIV